ncbi:threonine aldolase family protein [Cytobacillus purgationiresistens]|uniref:Threonine aldolase n=1 Tax=Cytobacillus purgationiresistens TaxID=863449 RepID=A0ABU0AK09_9BACI|nr:beta-eliminating lyase-related protein [Cytobacillus purgationiresistens]MDQ0271600.1 threonine aldolase [Cytobacillus purgationiresistens]
MNHSDLLKSTYNQSNYYLANHGKRNINILKEAFETVDDDMQSDMYGEGQIIEAFQDKIASFLGKEKAVFFPSGTMAQQIALRIWCDEKGLREVAYHPLSHLEIHEEDGLKEIHQIEPTLLADKDRVIELSDIIDMKEGIACVLLELPQREIGGQLPSYETLTQISIYCRANDIKLHLDGARLLEVLPYYKKTAAEVSALFDSVYVSFYKGIGGIAGAILAGDETFIDQSKVWKRRHGGDLISLYPYIITADYYFEMRKNKMEQYFEEAKELAAFFNACHGVSTLPTVPVSNMFHVHFSYPKEKMVAVLANVHKQTETGITANLKEIDDTSCFFELSLGDQYGDVPKKQIDKVFKLLNEYLVKH